MRSTHKKKPYGINFIANSDLRDIITNAINSKDVATKLALEIGTQNILLEVHISNFIQARFKFFLNISHLYK